MLINNCITCNTALASNRITQCAYCINAIALARKFSTYKQRYLEGIYQYEKLRPATTHNANTVIAPRGIWSRIIDNARNGNITGDKS